MIEAYKHDELFDAAKCICLLTCEQDPEMFRQLGLLDELTGDNESALQCFEKVWQEHHLESVIPDLMFISAELGHWQELIHWYAI